MGNVRQSISQECLILLQGVRPFLQQQGDLFNIAGQERQFAFFVVADRQRRTALQQFIQVFAERLQLFVAGNLRKKENQAYGKTDRQH